MKFVSLIPKPLKPTLRRVQNSFKKALHHPRSRDELHKYWKQPDDGRNLPEVYLVAEASKRSEFLVEIVKKYAEQEARILEIGCNAGRNLSFLFQYGYKNLEAIEISEQAIHLLKQTFPDVASHTNIYNAPVEEVIGKLEDAGYDIVFTMAVLEHIHTSSEWIFGEMVRVTKDFLIVIEDEQGISWRHFPRNYQHVFESHSMTQITQVSCNVEEHGLGSGFVARVFQKN